MLLKNLIMSIGLFVSVHCVAGPAVRPENAMVIHGVIQGDNIAHLGEILIKVAGKIDSVDLVISSPGGSVTSGFFFINQMEAARAKGLVINCFVPDVAASMAFGILVHCDHRYALSRAFLLWHRARVNLGGGIFGGGSPMTAPQLLTLGRDLASLDKVIFRETLAALGIEEKVVRYHFENETLHVGVNLHALAPEFITVYDSIPGLFEALDNKDLPRSKESRGIFGEFNPGEIIYISDKLKESMESGK